jgi:uncharacterized protein YndB with AHSA1/START domain
MPAEAPPAGAIEVDVDLPAPPAAAFAAWTRADEVTRWWGAEGVYRTTAWSAEVRPGGLWRAEFDDGGASAEGRYLVVEPARRLVWTWRASWAPDEETTLFMNFAPSERGARLVIRQVGLADAAAHADNEAAWRQITGWLEAHLSAATG